MIRLLKLWDISTGKCLKTLEGHTDRVCISSHLVLTVNIVRAVVMTIP